MSQRKNHFINSYPLFSSFSSKDSTAQKEPGPDDETEVVPESDNFSLSIWGLFSIVWPRHTTGKNED